MCHHRTTEYVDLYEDATERADLPEWAIEDDADVEDTESAEDEPEPFAPAETD